MKLGLGDVAYAYSVAAYAHRPQLRSGLPYVLHPVRVARHAMSWVRAPYRPAVGVVALLHDVVEDQRDRMEAAVGCDIYEWVRARFGESVCDALVRLTVEPGAAYAEHVQEALHDPLAGIVKLADVRDNALSLPTSHPRYERLHAKYAPLMTPLRRMLDRDNVRALLAEPDALTRSFEGWAAAAGYAL